MRAGASAPLWADGQVHTIAWSLQPEETHPCSPRVENGHCQEPEVGEAVLCSRGLHFKKGVPFLPRHPRGSGVPGPGSGVDTLLAHKELGPHRGNSAVLWAAAEALGLGQSLPSMASEIPTAA